MTSGASAVFDRLARDYDELWTRTGAGRLQRAAVWRSTDRLFGAADHILDLGCGTGEDAVHLLRRHARVFGIDASPGMVEVARRRGVQAAILSIEQLHRLQGEFDGALSNFGALNCIENLSALRGPLARLIRPGGYLAFCIMGRFCLWESLYYLIRGEIRKCARRWLGAVESSLGLRVWYPTVKSICRSLAPEFLRIDLAGIGVFVPPSFIAPLSAGALTLCGEIDRRLAHLPVVRALSDHRLLIFRRR